MTNDLTKPGTKIPVPDNGRQISAKSRVKALQLDSFETMWKFAGCLASSGMLPKSYGDGSPDQLRAKAMIALELGAEVGLQPMQAIQNIAVVNGNPTIWGDAQLGLVKQSGLLEYIKEEVSGEGMNAVATVTVQRTGEDEVVSTFSMQDAAKAKLTGKKGPWQDYPKRMLKYRARAFALRDVFPDVLKGLTHTYEEMIDVTPENEQREREEKRANNVAGAIAAIANESKSEDIDDTDGETNDVVTQNQEDLTDKDGLTETVEISDDAVTTTNMFETGEDDCPIK